MTDIKPCPFCGHKRSRLLIKREYCEDAEGRVAVRYRVCRACNKCGARGGLTFTDPQERDVHPAFECGSAYRANADAEWNRREGGGDGDV